MRRLVMVHRGVGGTSEAEPVVVEFVGGLLVVELDDGDRLVFDFDELVGLALGEGASCSVEAA